MAYYCVEIWLTGRSQRWLTKSKIPEIFSGAVFLIQVWPDLGISGHFLVKLAHFSRISPLLFSQGHLGRANRLPPDIRT